MEYNNLFNKLKSKKRDKVNINAANASIVFENSFVRFFDETYFKRKNKDIIVMCIGTDRSTGDSLGPLTGTKLSKYSLDSVYLFGTLESPVHAKNLVNTISTINRFYENPFIIAVDACLGKSENVGNININKGALKPGAAVNKKLPSVGNFHITGTVNIGGFLEYIVLQNTRLSLVMKMADIISFGIYRGLKKALEKKAHSIGEELLIK